MISKADALKILAENDGNKTQAAKAAGVSRHSFRRSLARDPATEAAMKAVNTSIQPRMVWHKEQPDGTVRVSVMTTRGDADFGEFLDTVRETIRETRAPKLKLPKRFVEREGTMMILDPADVHIGKLCVKAETGYEYNSEIAEHRLVEGCRMLVERGMKDDVSHVTLVIGNDIAHIDTPFRTTTSGTPQDTDGSIFTIYRTAIHAYERVVTMLLEMGLGVTIMFNPSNHDWILGFTIANQLQAKFGHHPNVNASDYNVSERHRKYLRFGSNLVGLSHGDGAKEKDLSELMTVEVRSQISDTLHRYWYIHHYHIKTRKMVGVRPLVREKDHISMTVMQGGVGAMEGDNTAIEIVRSPSAPDSWHDRNGYVGRQAVEAFVHHARDGQVSRFTEWF